MKVGIIGAGAVGAACLTALITRGCAREIVVVNRNRERARGLVTDARYGAVLLPAIELRDGDYADLKDADLILLTAGLNEKTGGATDRSDPRGRLRLLDANVAAYKEIVPRLHAAAPQAMVLVVTDPPDPLADVVRMLGHERVLSTGTYLDSLRFRYHLGRRLRVSPASVEAQVLGEHGTSEVFVWSSARIAGAPALELLAESEDDRAKLSKDIEDEVRYANIAIIEGIGASQHGIGMVSARIAEIVLRDERAVIPIGSFNHRYGVTLTLPSVLGHDGAIEICEPAMSEGERQALQRSAETLKSAIEQIRI
ncbi:MAG: NAD(P)-binding domain-containing protein [Alphaproteobacteria bacterium]|nr:NAD(P)-binding domain-containing protein [Alphaproteobacteria bacterium]